MQESLRHSAAAGGFTAWRTRWRDGSEAVHFSPSAAASSSSASSSPSSHSSPLANHLVHILLSTVILSCLLHLLLLLPPLTHHPCPPLLRFVLLLLFAVKDPGGLKAVVKQVRRFQRVLQRRSPLPKFHLLQNKLLLVPRCKAIRQDPFCWSKMWC